MSLVLRFIGNLWKTVVTYMERPAAPTTPGVNPIETLKALILSETEALGPFPTSGGQIFAVAPDEAESVANLIVADAKTYGLNVSLVASLIRGESDFSARSVDPNLQDAKPGETAGEALMHTDVGIEQEDVSTALGDDEFKGMATAEIATKLYDPVYGVRFVCVTLANNEAMAHAAFAADPSLASKVPSGDPTVLACEAYNTGFQGALHIAHTSGVAGNWKYGLGVVARAAAWAPLLDVA